MKIDKEKNNTETENNESSLKTIAQIQKETQEKNQADIDIDMEESSFDEFENEQDLLWAQNKARNKPANDEKEKEDVVSDSVDSEENKKEIVSKTPEERQEELVGDNENDKVTKEQHRDDLKNADERTIGKREFESARNLQQEIGMENEASTEEISNSGVVFDEEVSTERDLNKGEPVFDSRENQDFWNKMSQGGRDILNRVKGVVEEGVSFAKNRIDAGTVIAREQIQSKLLNEDYRDKALQKSKDVFGDVKKEVKRMPIATERFQSRVMMAYSQVWLKMAEKKDQKISEEINALDEKIKLIDNKKNNISGAIKRIEEQGIPADSIKKKLVKLNNHKNKLLARKNQINQDNSLKARWDRMKKRKDDKKNKEEKKSDSQQPEIPKSHHEAYVEKRNKIIDDLIKKCEDNYDLIKKNLIKLEAHPGILKGEKGELERNFGSMGVTWRVNNDKTIKELKSLIKGDDREERLQKILDRNRIIQDRIKVIKRFKKVALTEKESKEDSSPIEEVSNDANDTNKDSSNIKIKNSFEKNNEFEIDVYIEQFNGVVKEKLGDKSKFIIDKEEFLKLTGLYFGARMSRREFNKILNEKYYKGKDISLKEELENRRRKKETLRKKEILHRKF